MALVAGGHALLVGVPGLAKTLMIRSVAEAMDLFVREPVALLAGRHAVAPDDIRRVARPVLRHRILPNFAAEAEGIDSEQIVEDLLSRVPAPRGLTGL